MKYLMILLLAGCASFSTPGDYFVDGVVKGKPFALNQAIHPLPKCVEGRDAQGYMWRCNGAKFDTSKPVMIIPVAGYAGPNGETGWAYPERNEIVISQREKNLVLLLWHELKHNGGVHQGSRANALKSFSRIESLK